MTVVLDTNVIISSLINPGNCRKILYLWSKKCFQLYISQKIINEIEAVGQRQVFRKYFSEQQLLVLINFLKEHATFITPEQNILSQKFINDPKIFVDCALFTKADFLVTGNIKHFNFLPKTKIITPTEFLKLFNK